MALVVLLSPVANTPASGVKPEVEACIRGNAPKSTAYQHIKLKQEGSAFEEERILSAKVYLKSAGAGASNLLAVFDEPGDIIGSRLLFLEKPSGNEIYLYMPALFKVRRITSDRISSSMYGMDFSYEDFQWMYSMLSTAELKQQDDAVINGETLLVFTVEPGTGGESLYESIRAYLDKKTCVIRQVEFYEPGGKLRKTLSADVESIKKVDGILVPHRMLMYDVKKESETELTVVKARVDPPIEDEMFDPALLKDQKID